MRTEKTTSKKVIALFIAVVMVAGAFSGCQRSDPADDIELYWPEGMQPNEDGGDAFGDDAPDAPKEELFVHAAPASFGQHVKDFQKQNPDAVGWLYLPDTTINEVVVQREGSNSYYERRTNLGVESTGEGSEGWYGCYYADYESRIAGNPSQISPNIVIYGHSMTDNPDAEKFSQLKKLLNKDFAENHPYIYFSSTSQDYVYEIFSVMYTNSEDFYYIDCALDGSLEDIQNGEGMDMETLVAEAKAGSMFNYPSTPVEGDKIITLSTCTYIFEGGAENTKQRFVVFGRLLTAQDDMPETISLTENPNPKMPVF